MSYTYRYTNSSPSAFITLQKDGHGWLAEQGDTIDSDVLLNHPWLELVVPEVPLNHWENEGGSVEPIAEVAVEKATIDHLRSDS